MSPETKDKSAISAENVMAGVLALLIAEREDRLYTKGEPPRTEVILAHAGLTPSEIARIMGKKADTVAKTIGRARSGGKDAGGGAPNGQ